MHSAFKIVAWYMYDKHDGVCEMCDVLASNKKIKTTRDQVTTQSNIPVSNFVLLNSVDSLTFQF